MGNRMSNIATPMPPIRARFTSKLGIPLSGCRVYTYEPNSNIPKTTWINIDKTVENTNPILLDAAGEADIFLDGLYQIVVKDRFGFVVYDIEKTGTLAEWEAYVAQPFKPGKTYLLNERVQLINGDIVKSTIADNTANPNVDMTGWVPVGNLVTADTILNLLSITNPNDGMLAFVKGFHEPINFALARPYRGGSNFVYNSARASINDSCMCFYGWERVGITEVDATLAGALADGSGRKLADLYNESEYSLIYGNNVDVTATIDTIAMRIANKWVSGNSIAARKVAFRGSSTFFIKPVGEYIINKPVLLYAWNTIAYDSLITKAEGYAGVMFYSHYPYRYDWDGGVFSSKDEGTGAVWWLGTETATSFNIDQSKLTFRNFEVVGFKDVFAKFNSQSCIGLIEDWRICDVDHIIGRGLTLNTETGLYTEFLPKDFLAQASWYRTPDKLTVQQGWWETGHLFKEDLDALFYTSSDTTFKDTLGVPLERTAGKDVAFCNTLKNAHFDNARMGGETGSFAAVNFFGNNTQPYPYQQSILTFNNMELTGLNSVTGVKYVLAETLTGNAQTTLKLNRTDGLPGKGIMRLGQFFTYNSIDRATNTLNLESPVISYYAEGTEIGNLTSNGVVRLITGSPDLISFNECYHGTEMGQLVGYSSYSNLDAVVAQFKNTKLETNSVALKPLYQSGLGLPPALFYANPDKYNKQLLSNGAYGAEYTITQELAGVSSVGIVMQTTSLFDTIRYKVTLTNSAENNDISVYFVDLVKSITKVSVDTMLTYKVKLTIVSEGVAKITSVAINDFISDYGNFSRTAPIHIQHRVNYGQKLQISLNQSTTGSVKVDLA